MSLRVKVNLQVNAPIITEPDPKEGLVDDTDDAGDQAAVDLSDQSGSSDSNEDSTSGETEPTPDQAESKAKIDEVLSIGLPSLLAWIKEQQTKIANEENGTGELLISKPTAYVSKINNLGEMTIRFNKRILFPKELIDEVNR